MISICTLLPLRWFLFVPCCLLIWWWSDRQPTYITSLAAVAPLAPLTNLAVLLHLWLLLHLKRFVCCLPSSPSSPCASSASSPPSSSSFSLSPKPCQGSACSWGWASWWWGWWTERIFMLLCNVGGEGASIFPHWCVWYGLVLIGYRWWGSDNLPPSKYGLVQGGLVGANPKSLWQLHIPTFYKYLLFLLRFSSLPRYKCL